MVGARRPAAGATFTNCEKGSPERLPGKVGLTPREAICARARGAAARARRWRRVMGSGYIWGSEKFQITGVVKNTQDLYERATPPVNDDVPRMFDDDRGGRPGAVATERYVISAKGGRQVRPLRRAGAFRIRRDVVESLADERLAPLRGFSAEVCGDQ